jgi:class 3 adenylate cyclase/tetratricopeptide (TPR) repeat protein
MSDGTQRKLAAIVAADVVGYSRLMGEDEAGTLTALRHLRTDLFAPTVNDHNGTIVKSMGDGWLVEFASVVDAVTWAIEVQERLAGNDIVKLRIGVHLGDITHEDEDIYGDGVNIAARLQEIAASGMVLISQDAHRQLDGKVNQGFAEAGRRRLKNIAKNVDVFAWPAELRGQLGGEPAQPGGHKPRLYVPAFDIRGAKDEEFLAEGIIEHFAAQMARMTGIEMVSGADEADYQLLGAIHMSGNRRRLHAHLTYLPEDRRIWTDHYDIEGDDMFEAQERYASRLYADVRVGVNHHDGQLASRKDIESMSVDELLSLGLHKVMQSDAQSWHEIRPIMDRVLEIDPDNVTALAQWAGSIVADYLYGTKQIDQGLQTEARRKINRAQQLDQRSPYVHLVQSNISLCCEAAFDDAIYAAERSIELNPDFAFGYAALGDALIQSGSYELGMHKMSTALAMNPHGSYTHLRRFSLGLGNFGLGNYDEAAKQMQAADRIIPRVPLLLMGRATSLWQAGAENEARAIVSQLVEDHPGVRLGHIHTLAWREKDVQTRYIDGLRKAGLPE